MDRPLLIYDGDCGVCEAFATWATRSPTKSLDIAPFQTLPLERYGLTPNDCQESAWLIEVDGTRIKAERAVGRCLMLRAGFWRPIGWFILRPPLQPVAATIYKRFAKWRHRIWFGKKECKL